MSPERTIHVSVDIIVEDIQIEIFHRKKFLKVVSKEQGQEIKTNN